MAASKLMSRLRWNCFVVVSVFTSPGEAAREVSLEDSHILMDEADGEATEWSVKIQLGNRHRGETARGSRIENQWARASFHKEGTHQR